MGRAVGATPLVASRRCFLPEYATWRADFLAEVCAFPNAAHDDCVDALAYACAIAEKYVDVPFASGHEDKPAPHVSHDYRDPRRDEAPDPLRGFLVDGM